MASPKNTNKRRKERMKECYERGKENKKKRNDANVARQLLNQQRRANGEPTPWEVAKWNRAHKRDHARLHGETE
jgi:hypothetical protein